MVGQLCFEMCKDACIPIGRTSLIDLRWNLTPKRCTPQLMLPIWALWHSPEGPRNLTPQPSKMTYQYCMISKQVLVDLDVRQAVLQLRRQEDQIRLRSQNISFQLFLPGLHPTKRKTAGCTRHVSAKVSLPKRCFRTASKPFIRLPSTHLWKIMVSSLLEPEGSKNSS